MPRILPLSLPLAAAFLLLVAHLASTYAACPSLSLSISAPSVVRTTENFRAKIKVTNEGSTRATGLRLRLTLPVEMTLLKSTPAPSSTLTPWSLFFDNVTLGPGKSTHVRVQGLIGECFQGSLELEAAVAVPAEDECDPVTASCTVQIKANNDRRKKPSTCPTDTSQLTVECGVPLPLSSSLAEASFPMGTCGTRTTLDPRVFGPEAWQMLHIFAQNYPLDPQPQVMEACERMINALPYMLPSPASGYTFGQFITANIENAGTFSPACQASAEYDMPCQPPDVACLNQINLVNFFLRAHHSVDVKTKPCKALWSLQMAAEAYTYQTDFCATCIVWGSTPLCKTVGETGCSIVNTTQPCGAVAPYLGPTPAPVTQSPTTSPQLMVECGVTLEPSISSWAMGQCGNRTTADPRVFGPVTWRTVHRFAQHYPVSPTQDGIEACVNFVNALPFMLPCPHCGYDLSEFIVANIENAGTYSPACQANTTFVMPCETIEEACRTRPSLISFFLRAHHNVDTHNKLCKPLWSREQAFDTFAFQLNFCATGVVYGEYPLCRSVSDAACVDLRTAPPCGTVVPPPTH